MTITGPCRLCGQRSHLADTEGPVHPCCALHAAAGTTPCPACSASAAYWRKGGNHYSRKADAAQADRNRQAPRHTPA